ncbi:unnamed protein product [Lymnaea stagnalis]|uniref:Trimeric intracellular cation channel type B n=1 Tax=Lymnaea stagnalis TaxID=6523 RepID=A0AAV2IC38_LYMST
MAANVSTVYSLTELATYVMNVNMFPLFYGAHFVLASRIVREDSKDLGPKFKQNHPFASWFCTVIAGLSGVFVANFLFSHPLIDILKEHGLIIYITLIWYLMNYSPFDIVYKVMNLYSIVLIAAVLQEFLRVRFIYLGLQQAARVYPDAYIIMLIGGTIKGNGYGFIKIVERLIRGKWSPNTNEILHVTHFAKSAMYASLAFLLHNTKVIQVPIELLYLGIIIVFVVLRILIIVGGIADPLELLEKPVCLLLFGSGAVDTGKEKKEKKENEEKEKKMK